MSEAKFPSTTATLHAWSRLPLSTRLGLALASAIGASLLATAAIERPADIAAAAVVAVPAAPTRDPSLPDAGPSLSGEERQAEVSIPTF